MSSQWAAASRTPTRWRMPTDWTWSVRKWASACRAGYATVRTVAAGHFHHWSIAWHWIRNWPAWRRIDSRRGNAEMQALSNELTSWHEFYTLLGTAAGTLGALLFFAGSFASGVFSTDRRAPMRIFLSATVVHFSSVLVVSLILLAPINDWTVLGALVLV